jgi:4-hydroxythreonine-4-phosphate dehydrogenase
VLFRALDDARVRGSARFVAVGERAVLEAARRRFAPKLRLTLRPRGDGDIGLVVPDGERLAKVRHGVLAAEYGAAAMRAIDAAIGLAQAGEVAGIVTAPIHKQAMELAGVKLIGHTEILAERTQTRNYCLMLVHRHLRVTHVTCHQSLADAVASLSFDRVMTAIRLTYEMLVTLGVREPRIGVAGLNPHAGEGGLLGREDIESIKPAVMMARLKGVLASGPHPPDTVFPRLVSRDLDALVVQYHDQGHIPFKLLTFRHRRGSAGMHGVAGVNVTLGLPFVRTSVDHGVAFEIAGQGQADPRSMSEAITLAVRLSRNGHNSK